LVVGQLLDDVAVRFERAESRARQERLPDRRVRQPVLELDLDRLGVAHPSAR